MLECKSRLDREEFPNPDDPDVSVRGVGGNEGKAAFDTSERGVGGRLRLGKFDSLKEKDEGEDVGRFPVVVPGGVNIGKGIRVRAEPVERVALKLVSILIGSAEL